MLTAGRPRPRSIQPHTDDHAWHAKALRRDESRESDQVSQGVRNTSPLRIVAQRTSSWSLSENGVTAANVSYICKNITTLPRASGGYSSSAV